MPLMDRPILAYQTPPEPPADDSGFPWGLCSLVIGLAVGFGFPALDAVMQFPGYTQERIFIMGALADLVGIGCGIGSLFVPAKRWRGIVGLCLCIPGCVLLPSLDRA